MQSNKCQDRNRLSTLFAVISNQMQVTKAFCACSGWCFCTHIVNDYWSHVAFPRRRLNLSQITGWCFLALWATWWGTQSSAAERTRPVSSSISLHQSPSVSLVQDPFPDYEELGCQAVFSFCRLSLPPDKLDMHTLTLQHLSWGWQKSTCNMSFSLAAEILKPPVLEFLFTRIAANGAFPKSVGHTPQDRHFFHWVFCRIVPVPIMLLLIGIVVSFATCAASWDGQNIKSCRLMISWIPLGSLDCLGPYLENFEDIWFYLRHAFAVVEVAAAHWDIRHPNTQTEHWSDCHDGS